MPLVHSIQTLSDTLTPGVPATRHFIQPMEIRESLVHRIGSLKGSSKAYWQVLTP